MRIRTKTRRIRKKIKELNTKLNDVMDTCPHPVETLSKISKSNTGNYDPSADCYWYEFTCGECGKHWKEYQ